MHMKSIIVFPSKVSGGSYWMWNHYLKGILPEEYELEDNHNVNCTVRRIVCISSRPLTQATLPQRCRLFRNPSSQSPGSQVRSKTDRSASTHWKVPGAAQSPQSQRRRRQR